MILCASSGGTACGGRFFANLVASRWQQRKEQRRGGRKAERFVWRGRSATVVVKHETLRCSRKGSAAEGGSVGNARASDRVVRSVGTWGLADPAASRIRGVIRARDAGRGSALGGRWESGKRGSTNPQDDGAGNEPNSSLAASDRSRVDWIAEDPVRASMSPRPLR